MHKTMVSVASLGKIEIIRSQEFMASEARLKFLKKMTILGPKTAILGPQFCRILVLGPQFWWSGGPGSPGPPLDPPLETLISSPCKLTTAKITSRLRPSNFSLLGFKVHKGVIYSWTAICG